MNKKKKLNKVYGGDQQTVKSFAKIFSKGLDNNVIDQKEQCSVCKTSPKECERK